MSRPTPKQADKPILTHRGPPTFDGLKRVADATVLHPVALFLIPVAAYFMDKRKSTVPSAYPPISFPVVLDLIRNKYPWLRRLMAFIALRTTNHVLTRYVRNHGVWARQKPIWNQEIVVVTGGAAGIGRATVELLSHKKKCKIAVLDMGAPTYAKAPRDAPEILYIKTDVSDPASVKKAAEEIRAKFGEPTILMNCAGIANGSTILNADLASVARVWRINTLANWITAQEFLPDMVKKNRGHILTVASSASYMSLPHMAEYGASKSAALSFHEVLCAEVAHRYDAPNIRVSVACPTKVRTALGDGMEDHEGAFFTPNLMPVQVGQAIVDAFDSGLSQSVIQPELMRILPWMRAVPDWVRRIVNLIGNTDVQVTHKSIERSLKNGYGADWEDEEAIKLRKGVLAQVEADKAAAAAKKK